MRLFFFWYTKLFYIRSMIKHWLNLRSVLAVVAVLIVTVTVFYSNYLSQKIGREEKEKVEIWAEAQRTILNAGDQASITLASRISAENKDIPIIETNEKDSINPNNSINLDTVQIKTHPAYLVNQLNAFKRQHDPIVMVISEKPYTANKYYYGESLLQQQVRYYPIIQLVIVALFIAITVLAQRSSYLATQNQLWAGMAKETAHQLGTPVTSLQGWIEMLKEVQGNETITPEIEKDVNRLLLITDRFGKIGSQPHLEQKNLVEQVQNMVDYIRRRAGGRIQFQYNTHGATEITALISPPLFDWVIENLLKNALDAMDSEGTLTVDMQQTNSQVLIDISDTGKGISKANLEQVFKPGFTTKKRGWGLGLTLTRRIVEQYHKGSIFVKWSEPGKGTTFRVVINR